MTRLRVAGFSISLDGFGAGPEQSLENPLGKRGLELHQWFFGTRTFRAMTGEGGGSDGVDEAYAHRSMDGFGAFILGRNMFGPIRGPWPDESWKGWWGGNPPYHAPTFVLTHHPRDPIEMEGGTTFIFVTRGIEAALDQAKRAASLHGRLLFRPRPSAGRAPPKKPKYSRTRLVCSFGERSLMLSQSRLKSLGRLLALSSVRAERSR
jgi:dihydrofolate reductase